MGDVVVVVAAEEMLGGLHMGTTKRGANSWAKGHVRLFYQRGLGTSVAIPWVVEGLSRIGLLHRAAYSLRSVAIHTPISRCALLSLVEGGVLIIRGLSIATLISLR